MGMNALSNETVGFIGEGSFARHPPLLELKVP
jgi:hypothetical protein